MHKPAKPGALLALVLCATPLAAGAGEGLKLKGQSELLALPPAGDEPLPVFLEADRLQGHSDREAEAEGRVRLRKRGQAIHADWLRYDKPEDEVTARGNVRIEQGADVMEGSFLRFNLQSERGVMESPRYTLHRTRELSTRARPMEPADGRGVAERLLFEGPRQYRAERARYTTCGPENEDWWVTARELSIDKDRELGVARDASIVFQGVPIFYSPYLSFSLHEQRKSGFLTPRYGNTSKTGTELTLPYYWNIAPNRDATIAPRLMSRRGVLLDTEFRYLERSYSGEARIEWLPNDDARQGTQRHAFFVQHSQALPYGWSGSLKLQGVSDDTYFTDLATQIAVTSQVVLPREGTLSRGGAWGRAGSYGFSAFVQRWQTLQPDPVVRVTPPYSRAPQLTLSASHPDVLGADFDLQGQYVVFDHPTLVTGRRLLAYPSLAFPLQTAFAYLTPKLGLTLTHHAIDSNPSGFTDRSRALPVFTADAGLVLERSTGLAGVPLLQTLEPRAYYVYIPFRDQSRIPVFDSGQQDINFATIFSENQFSGWDRINDANQVTLGVTSRFLDTATGAERFRAGVAQRFYFASQRVTVPGVPARTSSSSDLLAAVSGTVAPHWVLEAGWQYSTNFSQTQKFNLAARYQPALGRVLNLSYRETLNAFRQTDVSAQWPIGERWTGLARWNYSLRERRLLEGLLGAEYNGDCWVLRVVAHRFAVATGQASTTFFVQLELNGVSRLGSNPLEALRRNIPGYRPVEPGSLRPTASQGPYY
jgi:LPS-assembly protein